MTNNEAAKWIQLYIDLANIDPTTGEEAYLNEDARKTLEAMSMAVDALIDKQAAADRIIDGLPSAQPEQPPYAAEIEAEYQKAVKMPHIHKPLAKALYEVWKKHDREDAERRTDG